MVEHLLPYFRIFRTPKVGPKTFYRLMQQFDGDHELILKFLKNHAYDIPSFSDIQKEIDALYRLKGRLLFVEDDVYPALLKNIDDAPPFLMMIGNTTVFNKNTIAVVGARNASLSGMRFIEKMTLSLSKKGCVIASGLARGIDTAAHKGSLENGTIAVLAGGVDQIYPLENRKIYEQIQENGAIISEMPLKTVPSAQLFARRNRVISGLSNGLIIAEAAMHSGSMITANFAINQGRDVFVIPGHPSDPRSEGGNRLIQQGAYLLHHEDDILDSLNSLDKNNIKIKIENIQNKATEIEDKNQEYDNGSIEGKILELLSSTPLPLEDLLNHFFNHDTAYLIALISEMNLKEKLILTESQLLIKKAAE